MTKTRPELQLTVHTIKHFRQEELNSNPLAQSNVSSGEFNQIAMKSLNRLGQ
jgi:hypothetical protein